LPCLDRPDEYRELVHALFEFDWRQPDKVARAYMRLLAQLISAHSIYLVPALHNLVRSLALQRSEEHGAAAGRAAERQALLHHTMRAVLCLAPSGCAQLPAVLEEHFPHRRHTAAVLSDYAKQLLAVADYVPLLQGRVLRLLVERCLEIDVEIRITDGGEAVIEKADEEGDAIFSMEVSNTILLYTFYYSTACRKSCLQL
jgi:RNA polymerase I-specific transcription initiation factor RRN3